MAWHRINRSPIAGYTLKSLSQNLRVGTLFLILTALIGSVIYLYASGHQTIGQCVDSEHIRCWSGHISTTSNEPIEDLCRELAEAQNLCFPDKTVVFLAARQKPEIAGFPNQRNYFCDFEERKRIERPLEAADSTGEPNRMAKWLCDFKKEES